MDWRALCAMGARPAVIYEHFHRYLFASHLVEGLDVLDVASGEGFGAAFLADFARSVIGIDIEPQAIEHSRRNYTAQNLEFRVGDARELTGFEPHSFGAVVAFEMIEHVREHDELLAGIADVLAPDGLLIMSTPNRPVYSDATGFENPFHVRELSIEELLTCWREALRMSRLGRRGRSPVPRYSGLVPRHPIATATSGS